MTVNLAYLYLLSPLHTGGTSQEGNLVGIARESHTNFPYLPSSTIRGRYRANVVSNIDPNNEDNVIKSQIRRVKLFGPNLEDLKNQDFVDYYELETDRKLTQLEQGSIWIGDGSILWFPVSSLSHGVIWISCPLLLQRWVRLNHSNGSINTIKNYRSNIPKKESVYLKDALIDGGSLQPFPNWQDFIPKGYETSIDKVLVLPNQHCETLIQMSLWRQVKVKLNEHKVVTDGSFRYEEAIPPDTLMYFPWGVTTQVNGTAQEHLDDFQQLLKENSLLQIGGQESLGRGFVQQWMAPQKESNGKKEGKG
ncbi:type III-B CRISPR module RAMP protein Cmr4 [Moorena producens JHB]|uniref:Type III-B CRISPR module RAMP protein Cmr4 n=1 Tax=Moorena producens (strain JHB) TaxID=1454205 RepID=A0A1D9FUM3_MOOP1|nr:type III-B CRISPR module RAMP protein Cmr4 [Moorena producens]AOY78993.1 type III-B CRISPR module RAMP protein Cmr4 [Moorena producens JHB]